MTPDAAKIPARKKRRRRKVARIRKAKEKEEDMMFMEDEPIQTKETMEEEPAPEPTPTYDTLEEKKMDLEEPVPEFEIIETKANIVSFDPPAEPPPPKQFTTAEKESQIELLKVKLELAELRAQLAEARGAGIPAAGPSQAVGFSDIVHLGRPMPETKDIPPGIPPMPEIDNAAGDKTPAFVEWLRQYWPEEYQARYQGRKTHLKVKSHEDEDDREEAKAPTFAPSSDPTLDTSPRQY